MNVMIPIGGRHPKRFVLESRSSPSRTRATGAIGSQHGGRELPCGSYEINRRNSFQTGRDLRLKGPADAAGWLTASSSGTAHAVLAMAADDE
jgi:hypothetical protein